MYIDNRFFVQSFLSAFSQRPLHLLMQHFFFFTKFHGYLLQGISNKNRQEIQASNIYQSVATGSLLNKAT